MKNFFVCPDFSSFPGEYLVSQAIAQVKVRTKHFLGNVTENFICTCCFLFTVHSLHCGTHFCFSPSSYTHCTSLYT